MKRTTSLAGIPRLIVCVSLLTSACTLSPGGRCNDLTHAVQTSNTNEVTYLLDAGANIDRPSIWYPWGASGPSDHQTPLTTACLLGNAGMVRLLLDRGADPNAPGGFKRAPLVAAHRGHTDIMRFRIGHLPGEAIDVTDAHGKTALHHACISQRSDLACVDLLLEKGARPDHPDSHQKAPRDYAQKALTYSKDKAEKQRIIEPCRRPANNPV